MSNRMSAGALAAVLCAGHFRRELSARNLTGHSAKWCTQKRATKQWSSGADQALTLRAEVVSVRSGGHTGKGRLIGALAGAGAAIAVATTTDTGVTEGGFALLLPLGAACMVIIGVVGGYYIGRAFDRPGPEFVLTP